MSSTAALITGASSGIGYELARVFARHGRDVVLVARGEDRLRALAERITAESRVTATVIVSDLARPQAPQEIHDALAAAGITVDTLVNNAGFSAFGPFADLPLENEVAMIAVNVSALTALTKLFLPAMLSARSGRILNLASTAAFQPGPLMAVYYATKAYVLHFSEALAEELEGSGVTVTALCPGPTRTGFQARGGLERSRLVQGEIASARSVAEFGYRALMAGKRVAIPGWRNRMLAQSVRFTPRRIVTRIVNWAQRPV